MGEHFRCRGWLMIKFRTFHGLLRPPLAGVHPASVPSGHHGISFPLALDLRAEHG